LGWSGRKREKIGNLRILLADWRESVRNAAPVLAFSDYGKIS
jgi:hypothetical protein